MRCYSSLPTVSASTKLIIFEGATPSGPANLKTIRIVGWLMPRSIRLTKFLSMPASSANCSCVSPASVLRRRNTFPNAIAGSNDLSQYTGKNLRLALSFGLHNILVILAFIFALFTSIIFTSHMRYQHQTCHFINYCWPFDCGPKASKAKANSIAYYVDAPSEMERVIAKSNKVELNEFCTMLVRTRRRWVKTVEGINSGSARYAYESRSTTLLRLRCEVANNFRNEISGR